MRELEFLPAWYPQTRKRKRLLVLQGYMSLILLAGLGLWALLINRNIRSVQHCLAGLVGQEALTKAQLQKLDEMLTLQKQWRQQAQVLNSLGLHVEMSRLIAAVESSMPAEMAVTEFAADLEETARPISTLSGVKGDKDRVIERRLKVKVGGVAPTDVDLANFLARLGNVPFFENIAMTFAREKSDQGHILREFQVMFSVDLNGSIGG